MLGAEQGATLSTDGLHLQPQHVKSHGDHVDGIAYAYNVPPPPQQALQPPPPHPHMDPGFYPPPWPSPGYGMFPFGPPGMMMPGMPPPADMTPCDVMPIPTNHQPNTAKRRKELGSGSPPAPPSRERFSYTRYQLELLNAIYTKIRYPNSMQKQLIAKRVGITREQVKIWFQNRRRKDVIGKTSAKEEYLQNTDKKMVPDDVIQSMLTELMAYENDPKGKKIKNQNWNTDENMSLGGQRRGSNCVSPPDLSSPDSNLSLSSAGSSPSMINNSHVTERLPQTNLDHLLPLDTYQPNSENFRPEVVSVESRAGMYPFRPEVFPDAANSLPLPMAGQAMALPVSMPASNPEPSFSSIQQTAAVHPGGITGIIDIVPDVEQQDELAPSRTMTPLTPVVTDSESSDSSYSPCSSSGSLEQPRDCSSEQHQGLSPEPSGGLSTQPASQHLASNIDISAPPNTVVMHTHHIVPLKRRRCDDSSDEEDDDEDVEPPRKRQERRADADDEAPPNTVAPPSEPIIFNPITITPSIRPLTVDIPRHSPDHQSVEGDGDQSGTRAPHLLAPVPLMPEPLAWPPSQWHAPRPTDNSHQGPQYPFTGRPGDTDVIQYALPPPLKPQLELPPSSFRAPYIAGPESYPWDAASGANNNNDTDGKQNCDKSMFNHMSLMSGDAARISSYGHENTMQYPGIGAGRTDMFPPPWMSAFSSPYSSYTPPTLLPLPTAPQDAVSTQQ